MSLCPLRRGNVTRESTRVCRSVGIPVTATLRKSITSDYTFYSDGKLICRRTNGKELELEWD